MTDFEPSGDVKRYVGFDWPKPNCENVSNLTYNSESITNLLHFEWGFDLRDILLNVSLQCRYINWLANWPCHVQCYNMCIANLKKGRMGPPVSSKLTVDRTGFATR